MENLGKERQIDIQKDIWTDRQTDRETFIVTNKSCYIKKHNLHKENAIINNSINLYF